MFIHLQKTGGKTLSAAIRYKYAPHALALDSTYEPLEHVAELPLAERRDARAVYGHMHFGVHRYIPRDCDYMTVLREPVSRVISTYNYIRSKGDNWLHDRVMRDGISLEEFAREAVDPTVDNVQTRLLSGRGSGTLLSLSPDGELAAPAVPPGDVTEADLELAKDNLDRFAVVGLTERFDESFILIRRALGWRLPMYETHNVSSVSSGRPSEAAVAAIRDRNRFDLELYEHARALFEEMCRREEPSLTREVKAFRLLNRIPASIGPRIPAGIRHQIRDLLPR